MKQFIKVMFMLSVMTVMVFAANTRVAKSEFKKNIMRKVEPDYRRGTASRDVCPIQYPMNTNSELTVIDSSANGYGMVSTVTRPYDVNSDGNMLVVYRQYAGVNTTHGQLGAGYGVVTDGEINWERQYNINSNGNPPWGGGGVGGDGTSQARYPSAIASEEYPYAVWNEYTGNVSGWPANCSDYGGRPYFAFDEFGWGGESWMYPAELDPLYDCTKDLWTGSVGYGYDSANDEHHVTAVYSDWTRNGSYQFTSEAVEDGYVVLGSELLAVNPQHLGTDGYSSAAILSMNDNGQGLLGVDGIFAGVDMDADVCGPPASNLTCNKTPMFKLTDDFGSSWYGDRDAFDFYYIPDNVFDDVVASWPTTDIDPCTGEVSTIDDFWSWYEFDMRVDNAGNPHMVISLIAESPNYFHFLDGYTGFYHFTIDRNHLDEPGEINSATGWNWSYIPLPANDSFNWTRPDGYSYLYGAMCQISLSRDNPDIVYMVANIANEGPMSSDLDTNGDGVEDDPCGTQNSPWELYPEWSEDIWVAKSSDNGSSWTGLENLTQTPRPTAENNTSCVDANGNAMADCGFGLANDCSPEEQYVHAAHWSDDERVYFQYNQPNWEFNEIGDPLGADCMNRVFLGYAYVEETGSGGCMDMNNCSYDADAAFDNGSCAIGLYTCSDGSFGCGCDDQCGDTLETPSVLDCAGVCGGDAVQLCSAGGGLGVCESASVVTLCTYSTATDCKYNGGDDCTDACDDFDDVNYWQSCGSASQGDGFGEVCGANHPAATAGDCSAWTTTNCGPTGGRCETCSDPTVTAGLDCSGFDPSSGTNNPCEVECSTASGNWSIETENGCDDELYGCVDSYTSKEDCDAANGFWTPFANDPDTDELEADGNPDECYCTADGAASACEVTCPSLGDVNGDGGFNVLDIVSLANCVLAGNCGDLLNSCAADMNGDGGYNVLDIVSLANCVLAGSCGGRVDDATEADLMIKDNQMYIESNGFIGGVQMTLEHGSDFSIEMTDRALHADYLTEGTETRLLVISPETDELFSFEGKFEIKETIIANSQFEVTQVDMPSLVTEFKLGDAYPNPFNPTTSLTLSLPMAGHVSMQVYNVMGQVVATLVNGYMDATEVDKPYTFTWDASSVSSGVYFVKVEANGFSKNQKIMLVK